MNTRNLPSRFSLALLGVLGLSLGARAAIFLDFNMPGRPDAEGNESGWTPWAVGEGASGTITVSGVKLTVARNGGAGTAIKSTYYKAGIQAPYYARLVADALSVVGGDAGASIRLSITGLAAGTHTLLAYHNAIDGSTHGDIKVVVNGTTTVSKVTQSNRVLVASKVPTSYVAFTVAAGATVNIDYTSNGSGSFKNVFINALALDIPNPAMQSTDPSPGNRDHHVDGDDGSIGISWKSAAGAKSHDLYFGTDSISLVKATKSSPEFKGNQTATTWELKTVDKQKIYWWRVDEIDESGTVTKGTVWSFASRRDAFRGAEGYGRYARGGRGGKVVHVTNLNDAGAGSLREAVENDIGPRTIVFDVGGTIKLASRLTLGSSFVTVAGQTAPGKGIQIRSAPFGLSGGTDVVVRFMKVRLGYGITYDGMGMQGSDYSILDHNTINWTIDEAFSSRSGKSITLQRTFIAEALNVADHSNKPAGNAHGYAGSIGGDIGSFHHNLLAHNEGRNWSLACGLDGNAIYWGRLDIFNNVVYNWGSRVTDGGCMETNFVGNYYKPGAATKIFVAANPTWDGFEGYQTVYCKGNLVPGRHTDTAKLNNGCLADPANPAQFTNKPFFPSLARIQSAAEAYKDVLSDIGANMPVFDNHDRRVLSETMAGTYKYKGSVSGKPGLPDRETDVGGFEDHPTTTRPSDFDTDKDGLPNWYEAAIKTSPNSASGDLSDAHADPDGDGWTNLDNYLDWMATPHAEIKAGASTTFNLRELFRGYTASPSYSTATNGCVSTSIKDSTLTVTVKDGCSFARLAVSVVDGERSAKTRDVLTYATGSTVGVGMREIVHKSFAWANGGGRIGVETDAYGTLTLRDPSGRILARATGSGTLSFATATLPRTLLIATFDGDGIRQQMTISAMR